MADTNRVPESAIPVSKEQEPKNGSVRQFLAGSTKYLLGAICVALSAFMLAPLFLSITASLKTPQEAAASPPIYLPTELSTDSYQRLWSYQAGLPAYLFNSLSTAFLTIAFTIVLCLPAAYALARFTIRGKEIIFVFLLAALIIPYQALLTPIFFLLSDLRLLNSVTGLAILHTAVQIPFSLYVLRNSIAAIPIEMEEAAMLDGAGTFRILGRILVPTVKPAIATVALFAFITSWNEFLGALVLMSKSSTFTLPVIVAVSRTETSIGGTDWGMLQAGVMVSTIPCVLVYLLLQKYYESGLLSGAGK